MFERIHQKLGTAGFVISIIALVAALGGGAYAASSNSGQATASAKAKQGKQGKPGKPGKTGPVGPAGTAGAQGPAGPAGPAGPKGDTGAAGTNGTNGAPGTSVTNTAVPTTSATCNHQGGAEFKVGSGATTTACNGVTGFTETLPSGATETGAWSIFFISPVETFPASLGTISFPIPLSAEGTKSFRFDPAETALEEFGKDEGASCVVGEPDCVPTGCEGTLEDPTAAPGVLCVYSGGEEEERINISPSTRLQIRQLNGENPGFSKSGALFGGLFVQGTAEEPARFESHGSWAVEAP